MNKIPHFIVFLCIISYCIAKSSGIEGNVTCEKFKCYQNVNTTHHSLLILINKLETKANQINYSGITQLYNNVDTLSNATKLLQNQSSKNIRLLNQIEKRNNKSLKNITALYAKIANISNLENEKSELSHTIAELENNYESLKNIFYQKNKTNDKCLDVKNKQLNLTNAARDVKKIDKSLSKYFSQMKNKVYDVNNNVEKTFQNAVKTKNDLDRLQIPDKTLQKYLNDTKLKLDKSVIVLTENAQLLENILTQIKQNLTENLNARILEIKKNVSDLQNDLETIDKALRKFEDVLNLPSFAATVNNNTIDTISKITVLINALESKIKSLNVSENFWMNYDMLINKLEKDSLELARLFAILDTIPLSNKKQNIINEELIQLRILISLEEHAKTLDQNIKLLEQQRDEALQINCTLLENLNNTGILT